MVLNHSVWESIKSADIETILRQRRAVVRGLEKKAQGRRDTSFERLLVDAVRADYVVIVLDIDKTISDPSGDTKQSLLHLAAIRALSALSSHSRVYVLLNSGRPRDYTLGLLVHSGLADHPISVAGGQGKFGVFRLGGEDRVGIDFRHPRLDEANYNAHAGFPIFEDIYGVLARKQNFSGSIEWSQDSHRWQETNPPALYYLDGDGMIFIHLARGGADLRIVRQVIDSDEFVRRTKNKLYAKWNHDSVELHGMPLDEANKNTVTHEFLAALAAQHYESSTCIPVIKVIGGGDDVSDLGIKDICDQNGLHDFGGHSVQLLPGSFYSVARNVHPSLLFSSEYQHASSDMQRMMLRDALDHLTVSALMLKGSVAMSDVTAFASYLRDFSDQLWNGELRPASNGEMTRRRRGHHQGHPARSGFPALGSRWMPQICQPPRWPHAGAVHNRRTTPHLSTATQRSSA